MAIETYRQALDWLYTFVRFDLRTGRPPGYFILEPMGALLARLGEPQARYPSVLIAGTKGKGSTAAILASILRAAGYRTGLYTSPHLHTFRERMRIDGTLITREEFLAGAQRLQALAAEIPNVTWFQLVTGLALNFFEQKKVDIAVLEVGLGGRLDATNLVCPRVSILTPVSYDHTDVLGSTLGAIAREKAGIIKPETPVISAPQADEARAVIEDTAREMRAPLTLIGRDWAFRERFHDLGGQRFCAGVAGAPLRCYRLPLLGLHQAANATTALAAARELRRQGWHLRLQDLRRGLSTVQWPVRFEVLARAPLIIADGAHNRASAHELAATLAALRPRSRVHWIFGASNDKDIPGMFAEILTPNAAQLILTRSFHPRAASPEFLVQLAQPYAVPAHVAENVAAALRHARSSAARGDVLCVTGSLFVAAEARALIYAEQGTPVETDD